jgi:hypothetical protein
MSKWRLPSWLADIADPSGLTDADWAAINKIRDAYTSGGPGAFSAALDELARDPILTYKIMGAFFPEMMREKTKDMLAESGITREDLEELLRKAESGTGSKH